MVDSAVNSLAEAFSVTTPLSQQDRENWRERIKDWRGSTFYKKIILPALLGIRVQGVDFDTGYVRALRL